jgi:hypothetical protein
VNLADAAVIGGQISWGTIIAGAIAAVAAVIAAQVSKGVRPTREALDFLKVSIGEVQKIAENTQKLTVDHLIAHSNLKP